MILIPLQLMMLTDQLMLGLKEGNRWVTFSCFLEFSSIHEKAWEPSPSLSMLFSSFFSWKDFDCNMYTECSVSYSIFIEVDD